MSISKKFFGKTIDDKEIYLYTLSNSNGMKVKIINYGAAIVSIIVKNKNGDYDDVVLGYDSIKKYEEGDKYFGAIVGRCANRIAYGKFEINGQKYELYTNNDVNHLHGGKIGFNKVVWDILNYNENSDFLELHYKSYDGEEGYPGTLNVNIKYILKDDDSLEIEYKAQSDKDTVVNLTNHSYFNLSGHNAGSIINHKVMINSDKFTVNNKKSIPTGEIRKVEGTPMDFRKMRVVGDNIDSDYEQIRLGNGYDHNWILNTNGNINEKAAEMIDESSGRKLELFTTMPCMQFYSSNFLDGTDIGKENTRYEKRAGICFETQYAPNAVNMPEFKSPVLKAGEEYNQKTIFKFSLLKCY